MHPLGVNLAVTLLSSFKMPKGLIVWLVFALCLAATLLGVVISFVLFGSTLTGVRAWLAGPTIALVMLGLSYGAKYANTTTRKLFTPLDLIQFFSQGFLWSSSWPTLATLFGVDVIEPPTEEVGLLSSILQIVASIV